MKWLARRILPPFPLILPSVLSGVLVTLCFPLTSLGPVAFLALAPMFVALLRHRPGRMESFRAGFLAGSASFITMLWWIVKLIPTAGVTIPWLMTPALVVLVLYLALYPAFFALILASLTRWRLVAFVVAAPATWAILEVARSRGELAFPWGVLGYSLTDQPALLQTAEFAGVFGVSFLIVLVNALVAGSVAARGPRAKAWCGVFAGCVAGGMWLYGAHAIDTFRLAPDRSIRVALAQPNIDLALKWKPEFKDSTFALIEKQAVEARAEDVDMVIFPETSAPMYIENSPVDKLRLVDLARALETPIYIGFLDHRFDGPARALNTYNSSGLIRADGSIDKYDKRHLLPFGEALPLAWRYRWIRKIDFGQANFQRGPRRVPLSGDGVVFTPLICFESVFPDLCRDGVREGAELFVNITNDGWFGDTPGPHQHAQMAIVRAVEFRRWLVRSANSGITMVVAPSGEVTQSLDLYNEALLIADVGLRSGETFYARHGELPLMLACLALLGAAVVWARRESAA